MEIRNKKDLQFAFSIMYMLKKQDEETGLKNKTQKMLLDAKKSIRTYLKEQDNKEFRKVLEGDIDGYTEEVELPDFITDKEMAEDYFNEVEKFDYYPSQYDCTGQRFSVWHSIVNRRGRMWLLHKVAIDI